MSSGSRGHRRTNLSTSEPSVTPCEGSSAADPGASSRRRLPPSSGAEGHGSGSSTRAGDEAARRASGPPPTGPAVSTDGAHRRWRRDPDGPCPGRRLVVRDPSSTVRVPTMPTEADTGSTVRTEGLHAPPEPDRKRLSFLRELPVLIILAVVLALVLKTFVVQAFFIPSDSMVPTLVREDRVLVNKVLYHPHRADLIVFEDPHPDPQPDRSLVLGFVHWLSQGLGFSQPSDEDFIKRVVGLPGETLEIRDHEVLIDGKVLAEPYLTRSARATMYDFGPVHIPTDAVFVMGDNRGHSDDSRGSLGYIPLDRIIGRAFVRIWPPSRIGLLHG